jgi:Mg2+/Co2+ transporter CorB
VAAEYHPHADAHDGHQTDIVISSALSKDELRTIVNESRSQISRRNQDMLLSVLDLEKVSVDDIMVPRNEIVGIDINDDWKPSSAS